MFCIKAFHDRIMSLNTLKHNSQGIEMNQLPMSHTNQITSSRPIRNFSKYIDSWVVSSETPWRDNPSGKPAMPLT